MSPPGERRPLIEVDHVTFGYDARPVLEDVSLTVRRGDFLAVIGPNGGGKTTLIKLMLGLLDPWSGSVRRHVRRRGGLGWVPQFAGFDRNVPARVEDVVRMGRLGLRGPLARFRDEDRAAARRALDRVALGRLATTPVADLSGGQLQRTLIARALASEPEVLLLDEPLASVDAEVRTSLVDVLVELNREVPLVVVTHDLTALAGAVRQIACVNRRLHYHPEGKVTGEMLEEVYGCPVELIAHGVPHRVLEPHDAGGGTAGGGAAPGPAPPR
ncbi:MAG TPA: metal ABC transporter ATP-binding protein [Thermoanaerobaculia bacterium]